MEIFGDLERLLSQELYPYRWPLSAAAVIALGAAGWLAWRAGWIGRVGSWARRRPLLAGVSAALIAAVVLPTFWVLASPLWTRTTLVEASPLAAIAATAAMTETATTEMAATEMAATETGTTTAAPPPATTSALDTNVAATPAAAEAALPRVVLEGTWSGADDFHFAEGRALVIETEPGVYTLRVEDFSIRNGPDLFVYISPDALGYVPEAVKLGALKATDGAFNYEIPDGTALEQIRSAVVWCDAFAVLFGTASFN
ncbi:MAG: DM13 domain-containing protein [Dehalococcoidia bacterium]